MYNDTFFVFGCSLLNPNALYKLNADALEVVNGKNVETDISNLNTFIFQNHMEKQKCLTKSLKKHLGKYRRNWML